MVWGLGCLIDGFVNRSETNSTVSRTSPARGSTLSTDQQMTFNLCFGAGAYGITFGLALISFGLFNLVCRALATYAKHHTPTNPFLIRCFAETTSWKHTFSINQELASTGSNSLHWLLTHTPVIISLIAIVNGLVSLIPGLLCCLDVSNNVSRSCETSSLLDIAAALLCICAGVFYSLRAAKTITPQTTASATTEAVIPQVTVMPAESPENEPLTSEEHHNANDDMPPLEGSPGDPDLP